MSIGIGVMGFFFWLLLFSCSVVFNSFVTPLSVASWLLCPWDFPGKNTGVGRHFLFQGIFPDSGIQSQFPALAGSFFTIEPPGKPLLSDEDPPYTEGESFTFPLKANKDAPSQIQRPQRGYELLANFKNGTSN